MAAVRRSATNVGVAQRAADDLDVGRVLEHVVATLRGEPVHGALLGRRDIVADLEDAQVGQPANDELDPAETVVQL